MPTPNSTDRARALLRDLGAERIPHPGGTLLAHLDRVRTRLAQWGARPDLQTAGLCHACYGTDGFPEALLPLDRRAELAAVIGEAAEEIVRRYAGCAREATYATLGGPDVRFHDRFTGTADTPSRAELSDFAELTAANEIDLAAGNPAFRDRHGPGLLALFTRLRPLLSEAAWDDCRTVLGSAGRP
ncbi:hypothetical protein JS756_21475 [Streptomyces actuosus]|uniref:DUF6817 domain-containing protein n=1 Tax=Streptomyces actuosus TaxID=1885 RepID=A0ABS2VU25_STRAS|nr:hypothetical protein [Streptomyces actuosus]MBN0046629.1 hypothetical protein [Streptomyces actuosus]